MASAETLSLSLAACVFGSRSVASVYHFVAMSVLTRRLGAVAARLSRRGYGSAAAAQLDYENYYSYEGEGEEGREMEESAGWETPGRGVQWVMMGDPLVRRHVYAHRLAKLLDVPHISMGSLVRQELNPDSPLHRKIASAVNQGELVPEDVIFGLLTKRLEEGYRRGESGFILDGIPRTTVQAEILDEIADVDMVVNLKCKEDFGGRIYSPLKSMATKYTEQMKAVEDYYKQQKKIVNFQVSGAPGDTWEGLLAALTANSSHKLTA